MSALFESKPRWTGAPPICLATNLLAFAFEALLLAFHLRNGPSTSIDRKWLCESCGHWHHLTHGPDPAGNSSGTTRSHKRYQSLNPEEKCAAIGMSVEKGIASIKDGRLRNGERAPDWLRRLSGSQASVVAAEADQHPEAWPQKPKR